MFFKTYLSLCIFIQEKYNILSKLPDKATRDDREKARENTIRLRSFPRIALRIPTAHNFTRH